MPQNWIFHEELSCAKKTHVPLILTKVFNESPVIRSFFFTLNYGVRKRHNHDWNLEKILIKKEIGHILTNYSQAFNTKTKTSTKIRATWFLYCSLKLVQSYLCKLTYSKLLNASLSDKEEKETGDPQDPILKPLLLITFLNYIFFFDNKSSL